MPRLMVIDDDESILQIVKDVALACEYEVLIAQASANVIATIQHFTPSVVLLDLAMPDGDGVKLMRQLAGAQCTAKIVILSGADSKMLSACYRLGREYGLDMCPPIAKPFAPELLSSFLDEVRMGLCRVGPQEMMEGLGRGEFEARYQPKVDLRDGSRGIVGAEALLRWNHPKRGLLSANRFIAVAESEGLIEPLSSWVLAEVIAQLRAWERNGHQLVVSVNLPSSLFTDLDFPDRVEAMLKHAGVPAPRLMLEITERGAMQDGPTAIDVLTRFRLKEVQLSIDDFGVGHSSLVELYRMPFNELKIDASFVRDLTTSTEARTIVRTLITLAHELGLAVCAEGVETHDAARALKAYGCDTAQGFLYGSAMTPAEFDALLSGDPASMEWTSGIESMG